MPGEMRVIRGTIRGFGGAAALAAILLVSATSAEARTPKRKTAPASAAKSGTFGAFTPATADPRIAAAFARSGLGTASGTPFRFTPSGNTSSRRAITVAVRARNVARGDSAKALGLPSDGLAPSAYSLGASIGWKRFALSGDVAKVDNGILPDSRESADLGLSFFGKRWETKLDVAGERSLNDKPAIGIDQSWSVGLGGSYSLTRNLNVSGSVRYKTQRDDPLNLLDNRRDSQAVYLGTTFKF
jgi:opacity protein-like surface antigen